MKVLPNTAWHGPNLSLKNLFFIWKFEKDEDLLYLIPMTALNYRLHFRVGWLFSFLEGIWVIPWCKQAYAWLCGQGTNHVYQTRLAPRNIALAFHFRLLYKFNLAWLCMFWYIFFGGGSSFDAPSGLFLAQHFRNHSWQCLESHIGVPGNHTQVSYV